MPPVPAAVLPRGFAFSAAACGLKKSGLDLGLIVSEVPAAAACLFTTNYAKAAPVLLSQSHLRRSASRMRAIIVNSGNANCATGPAGLAASRKTAEITARETGCMREQIIVCSTGVIGVPFAIEKILKAVPPMLQVRAGSAASFQQLTRAIMTTDRRPKWASASCTIAGTRVRLLACAKGAGMIHPQMATMLAFIATDATVSAKALRRALRAAAAKTFNAITVDGDTSTNDTLAVLANAASGAPKIHNMGSDYRKFAAALELVCRSLALQIVQDGEGAQRLVEVIVRGAASDRAAGRVARTIATSPLVKTAIAGADPNWGRILAAAGRSGVRFDPARVEVSMGGIRMCSKGSAVPFNERAAHHRLLGKRVPITVDLHSGKGMARVWTCDLTEDYVRINASYRS